MRKWESAKAEPGVGTVAQALALETVRRRVDAAAVLTAFAGGAIVDRFAIG